MGAIAAGTVLLALVLSVPTWAAPPCLFHVDGDGNVVVRDPDGQDFCEWPRGQKNIRGALTFPAGTGVEFVGVTSIRAHAIVVEPGATLRGEAETLRKLTLVAWNGIDANIRSHGRLDIEAREDVIFRAKHSIDLGGVTNLKVGNVLILRAVLEDVTILPAAITADDFTLFARNRIEIAAPGARGSIELAAVRIGAFRIVVRTRANLSQVGEKRLRLRDGTLLTTDRTRTGLSNSGNILLDATGPIVITDAVTLDAGTNVTFRTQRQRDDVCLSHDTTVEAGTDSIGRLYLGGVRGTTFDDGSTAFRVVIIGNLPVPGTCEEGPATTTTTSVSPQPTTSTRRTSTTTTTTTVPSGLTSAQWEFYVRIARTDGSETSVNVPKRSGEAPVAASIRTDHLSAFAINDQVPRADIEALGGDTLARLTDAARGYLEGHPTDYPGFDRIVTLVWAKRVLSTTTTTLPRTFDDACRAVGINPPGVLPNQATCTDTANTDCNGWTDVTREFKGTDDLASLPGCDRDFDRCTARFYKWEDNPADTTKKTTCFYLYRQTKDRVGGTTQSTLNGVHCYNNAVTRTDSGRLTTVNDNCNICAWDYPRKTVPPGPQPAVKLHPLWTELYPASLPASQGAIEDCSQCHAAGPIAPRDPFFTALQNKMSPLMFACAEKGGPQWVGAPAAWAQRDNPLKNVGFPTGCGSSICHDSGFIKGTTNYCTQVAKYAFTTGGAMKGRIDANPGSCAKFAGLLGCDATKVCP